MYVEMRTSMAGTRFSIRPGELVELDHFTAQRLIDRGYAVEVSKNDLIRTGSIQAPENASSRTAKKSNKSKK